jgi:hypothetical protein
MNEFHPKFLGEKTQGQIMYWVRKMLAPYNVKVNKITDKTNTCFSALTVGGFYDPQYEFGDKDIELWMMFRKEDETIFCDDITVKVMINEIFKTFVHEKRHRYQFKKRGLAYGPVYRVKSKVDDEDILNEMKYYGDPDELDAYAQESVIEHRLHGESETLAKYQKLFANADRKVYNRFLKKYYTYDKKITL